MHRRPFLAALAALLFGWRRRPAPESVRCWRVDRQVRRADGTCGVETTYAPCPPDQPSAPDIVIVTVDPISRRVVDEVRYHLNRGEYLRRPILL